MDPLVAMVRVAQLIFKPIKFIVKQSVSVVRAISNAGICILRWIGNFVAFKVVPFCNWIFAPAIGALLVWLDTKIAETFPRLHFLLIFAAQLIYALIILIAKGVIKLVRVTDYLLIRPASLFFKWHFVPVFYEAFAHALLRRQKAAEKTGWIKAASIDGGFFGRFYRVLACDFDQYDDPFCAKYPSIVYFIEMIPGLFNATCCTLVVWRVSLATGIWKAIHRTPFKLYMHALCVPKCYISRGVISVSFVERIRFIFDTQYGKSATFGMEQPFYCFNIVCVLCVGRLLANGTIDGWTMRVISTSNKINLHENDWDHLIAHATLTNQLCELRLNGMPKLIKKRAIIFGDYLIINFPHVNCVRVSGGLFGVFAQEPQSAAGPAIVYDPAANRYVYYGLWESLLQEDDALSAFMANPMLAEGDYWSRMCPVFLNDRACIQCPGVQYGRAEVFLMELAPPTLKFSTVRSLFQARPEWREQMTADQFTEMTGIRGVEGHFR